MKIRFFGRLVLLSMVLSIGSCGGKSAGDILRGILTSPSDERKMGEQFDELLRNGDSTGQGKEDFFVAKDSADSALVSYIDSLGRLVSNSISDEELEDVMPSGMTREEFFSFSLINSDQVNAFAVPGGFVFIYTEILNVMQSEAEFVSVIGHELGHVLMHHSRDRMQNAAAAQGLTSMLLGDELLGKGGQIVTSFILQNYGQADELQADSIGIRLSAQSGENPEGIQDFFGRDIVDKDGNCDDSGSFTDVFSTHPPDCDRVNQSKEIIQSLPAEEKKFVGSDKHAERFKEIVNNALN